MYCKKATIYVPNFIGRSIDVLASCIRTPVRIPCVIEKWRAFFRRRAAVNVVATISQSERERTSYSFVRLVIPTS